MGKIIPRGVFELKHDLCGTWNPQTHLIRPEGEPIAVTKHHFTNALFGLGTGNSALTRRKRDSSFCLT